MKKLIFYVITLLVIVLVAGFCFVHFQSSKNLTTNGNIQSVKLLKVKAERTTQMLSAYGQVYSPHSVDIKSQTNGIIKSIRFSPGEKVVKGQVLATIASNDVSSIAQKLKAKLSSSESTYHRMVRLSQLSPESVSKMDIIKAKANYLQDKSAYQEAFEVSHVVAPESGIVSATSLKVGGFVTEGEYIASIANHSDSEVEYALNSQYLNHVRVGQKIQFVPTGSHKTYRGRVSFVSSRVDPKNLTLTLRATLDGSPMLPENLFGKITQLVPTQQKVIEVPAGYVMSDQVGFFVYVIHHGKVAKQYVKTKAITDKGNIIIQSGLKSGDNIITSNLMNLAQGEPVKVGQ